MPTPVSGTTVTRRDLSDLAIDYAMTASQRGFVGMDIMPMYGVAEEAGEFPKLILQNETSAELQERAAGAAYDRDDFKFEDADYKCRERGIEYPIDDRMKRRYGDLFNAETVATQIAVDRVLRDREKRIATAVEGSSNGTSVSTEWTSASSATPQADVEAAAQSILNDTGVLPNTLVLPFKTMKTVLKTDDVLDNIKYTSSDAKFGTFETKKQILADFFGVDRVVVPNATYNSAKEGAAYLGADIWDETKCFLCIAREGALEAGGPQWGRTFVWTADVDGEYTVEMYREEQTRGDVVRARTNDQLYTVNSEAGYLLSGLSS